MGRRVDLNQMSLLDWCPAPEPAPAKKARKAKLSEDDRLIASAKQELCKAVVPMFPKGALPPWKEIVSVEWQVDPTTSGADLRGALTGRLIMFDDEENTVVIEGRICPLMIPQGAHKPILHSISWRGVDNWPPSIRFDGMSAPMEWNADVKDWKRLPKRVRSAPKPKVEKTVIPPSESVPAKKVQKAKTKKADTVASEVHSDPFSAKLIASGIATERELLNGHLLRAPVGTRTKWPWYLPSSLFEYPIEFIPKFRVKPPEDRAFYAVRRPDLLRHPFVERVAKVLGEQPFVFSQEHDAHSLGQHARDLCSERHWQDLLKTRDFTLPHRIAAAVRYALTSRPAPISVDTARAMAMSMGWPEPQDRSAAVLIGNSMVVGTPMRGRQAFLWHKSPEAEVWALIHAIEDDWVTIAGQDVIHITDLGIKRKGLVLQAA